MDGEAQGGSDAWRQYEDLRAERQRAAERGPVPVLIGAEEVDGAATVCWADTEADVEALALSGYPASVAVSAPPGHKSPMDAVKPHADALLGVNRFVLAIPAVRETWRDEVARQMGRHRCLTVAWPSSSPTVAQVLERYGPDGVTELVEAAVPYPIEGLMRVTTGLLGNLRRRPPPAVMTTGTGASDAVLKLPTEGRLIVLTGFPSAGKTSWLKFVMVHTARQEGRRWAMFSPESQPWEHFASQLAEVYIGKPFYRVGGWQAMNDEEIGRAEGWLADRVTMLVSDAEGKAPTLDWLIERATYAVLRDGVTDLGIDPWNEIDQERGASSETDYTGRALQRLKAFGLRYGCNVWIVVHPAKPQPLRGGEKRVAPGPYDISGSSHWANKTDVGITLHGPGDGTVEMHLWKSRLLRWGKRGALASLDFEPHTGVYTSVEDRGAAAQQVQTDWIAPDDDGR